MFCALPLVLGNLLFVLQYEDTNLPIAGYYSVVGRSIVIHGTDSSRWSCADLVWDAAEMGGRLIQAQAKFTGEIVGDIVFVST